MIREVRGSLAAWANIALVMLCLAATAEASLRSNPPRTTFLVDTAKGTIAGTLKRGVLASAFMQKWGLPDYGGSLEPGKIEMLWSRTTHSSDAWAVARLSGPSSTKVIEARFGGGFKTSKGDRRGTGLTLFLKHWPDHGTVVPVSHNGVQVEWNVMVGNVVFAFDMTRRLQAIGLAAPADAPHLCAIPSVCVTSSLK